MVQFIFLKYTTQWFLVYSQVYATFTTIIIFRTFFVTSTRNFVSFSYHLP